MAVHSSLIPIVLLFFVWINLSTAIDKNNVIHQRETISLINGSICEGTSGNSTFPCMHQAISQLVAHSLVHCKHQMANTFCKLSNAQSDTIMTQYATWIALKLRMLQAINHQSDNLEEIRQLITEAKALLELHKTTKVDLCGSNVQCRRCLERTMDCFFSKKAHQCADETLWSVMQYRPKKIEAHCQLNVLSYKVVP